LLKLLHAPSVHQESPPLMWHQSAPRTAPFCCALIMLKPWRALQSPLPRSVRRSLCARVERHSLPLTLPPLMKCLAPPSCHALTAPSRRSWAPTPQVNAVSACGLGSYDCLGGFQLAMPRKAPCCSGTRLVAAALLMGHDGALQEGWMCYDVCCNILRCTLAM